MNENLPAWISALQDYLYLMGANERQSVAYAATLLQGAARVWWDSYLYDHLQTRPANVRNAAPLTGDRGP